MPIVNRVRNVANRSESTLVFHRAPGEGIKAPDDLVELLHGEGLETGILRAQNPITHDQWWIPVIGLAKAGLPYVIALGAVIRTWLKEHKGRQVRFENGRLKISANRPSDVERLLRANTKYEKQLRLLHVTKAEHIEKSSPKKIIRKRSAS